MFHVTKVLGTFAPEERKFHKSESSKERMFPWDESSTGAKVLSMVFSLPERKCRGTKRPGIRQSHQCLRLILTLLACYTTYTLNSFKNRADHFLCINKVYKVSITFLSFLAFRAGRGQSSSSSSTYFFLLLIFLSSPTSESKLASLLVRLRVLRANI